MRVLVTGATGFIGQQLVALLASKGYWVRGTKRAGSTFESSKGPVEWKEIRDITSRDEWLDAVRSMDAVIHLAGLAHQLGPTSRAREHDFQEVNTHGTEAMVAAAAENNVRRVLLVSSIAVFGDWNGTPFTEKSACVPNTPYGHSKLRAEIAVERVLQGSSTDWTIIRPPLVYGKGNPGNMDRLMRLIDRALPLPLASVNAQRSYVYVGNLTNLLSVCLEAQKASRRTFVVDDGEPIATKELIGMLAEMTGKPARLFPCPLAALKAFGRIGDVIEGRLGRSISVNSYSVDRLLQSLVVDSSEVRRTLEWKPPYTRTEGMHLTIAGAKDRTKPNDRIGPEPGSCNDATK